MVRPRSSAPEPATFRPASGLPARVLGYMSHGLFSAVLQKYYTASTLQKAGSQISLGDWIPALKPIQRLTYLDSTF